MVVSPATVVFLGRERLSLNSPMEMRRLMLSRVRALEASLACIQRLFQLIIGILQLMDHPLAVIQNHNEENKELPIRMDSQIEQITEWLKDNAISATSKQIKTSLHIRSLNQGFEIEFENDRLSTFFAYFRSKKISCFEYPLKFGINKGWTIKGAVMYLGEPPQKSAKTVEIIYPHLGLGLVFLGSYNNEDSLIDYVYLYPPEPMQVCAACKKQFTKVEDRGHIYNEGQKVNICPCGIVKYCSSACEKKHHGQHLIFCHDGTI